jgi:uncharacterized protein (UPF0264 family)
MPKSKPRGAPAFLASVRNAEEACVAFAAGADVIDCKDPAAGALGRLGAKDISQVVAAVSALAPVSATIGDSFASVAETVEAAEHVAATGVAIVKCGFFGTEQDVTAIAALASAKLGAARLFAVLMADRVQDFSLVPHLARAGFMGVMLDTAGKANGSLPDIMAPERLEAFIAIARAYHMAVGLAGSLKESDISPLVALSPDILGFRGALCADGRTGTLDEERVIRVRRAIDDAASIEMKRSVA